MKPTPTSAASQIVRGSQTERDLSFIVAIFALCVLSMATIAGRSEFLTAMFFLKQDMVVAYVALGLLVALYFWRRPPALQELAIPAVKPWALAAGLVAFVTAGAAGNYFVMNSMALSRDEQMVVFDAAAFADGSLIAAIPDKWRAFVGAMNQIFLIVTPANDFWISAYLPINGLLHAIPQSYGAGALVNPALAALGLYATCRVASRLWPEAPETVAVAALLYLTSAQMWAMSMTTYAMTGHLAFNMVWLMFFLRDDRVGHAGAIATGFVATGLHQLIFHPLFAAPFLCLVVLRKRWRLAAIYALSYLMIGLFWAIYTKLTIYAEAPGAVHEMGGIAGYIERVRLLLVAWSIDGVTMMCANIVRFLTWQNLLLLPLIIMAAFAARRSRPPLMVAMFASLALTPLVMLILMPYQGHGWGYRYMHGLIGIACLLGAAGWHEWRAGPNSPRPVLIAATAATVFLSAPYLLWQAHTFVAPFAAADRQIANVDADVVLIGFGAPAKVAAEMKTALNQDRLMVLAYSPDLTYNGPSLKQRPVRLEARRVDSAQLAWLCARYSVVLVEFGSSLTDLKTSLKCGRPQSAGN